MSWFNTINQMITKTKKKMSEASVNTIWVIKISRLHAVTTPWFTLCPDYICSQKPSVAVVLLCPLESSKEWRSFMPGSAPLTMHCLFEGQKMTCHAWTSKATATPHKELIETIFAGAELTRTQLVFLTLHFQSESNAFSLTCTHTRHTSVGWHWHTREGTSNNANGSQRLHCAALPRLHPQLGGSTRRYGHHC